MKTNILVIPALAIYPLMVNQKVLSSNNTKKTVKLVWHSFKARFRK